MNRMNDKRLDLNLLAVFEAVHTAGSVTGAAARLNLSQPAISHALNRLRSVTGDLLFVRSGGRLAPTPRALAMAGETADVIRAAMALLAKSSFDPAKDARRFRIASSDYSSLTLAPAMLKAVRKQAPGCMIDMFAVGGSTLRQLASGEADCSFWGVSAPERPFCSELLFDERLVGAMDRNHPLAGGPVGLWDYLACAHATVTHGASTPNPIDEALRSVGAERRVACSANGFAASLAASKGTDLLVTIPSRLSEYARAQGLVCFELPVECASYPYYLVWHERTSADKAHAFLRKLIVESAKAKGPPVRTSDRTA